MSDSLEVLAPPQTSTALSRPHLFMARKYPREIPEVYRRRVISSKTLRSRRIFGPRTLYNPQHRPSDSPIMRVYNDSVFGPDSSYSASVTRDAVDAFDTTPRIPSPSPLVRATRKTVSTCTAARAWQFNSSDYKARIAKLGIHGRRVMQYYSGNTSEAQIRTLKKLEEYKLLHNQSPIAPIGKEGPRGGESQLKWECRICNMTFATFQKVAVHLTSREWCLPNWRCSGLLCARIYQSRNELNRHEKSHFNAGRKKSPAAITRASLGAARPLLPSTEDEKHSPTTTAIETVEPSVTNSSIQPISHQQMDSIVGVINCDCVRCPSQAIPRNSCDSEIGDSMHLVGPRYLSTEPAQPQTVIHAEQYQLQPIDIGWRAANHSDGVALSSSLRKAETYPFVTSMEWPYSKPGVSDILLQRQGGSIDIIGPATSYQLPSPQPGDLLQQPFMSNFSSNVSTNPPMAPVDQPYYSPHAYDPLANQSLSQDVTANHELPRNCSQHDWDLETLLLYLDTRHSLEQPSTPLNRSVSDSHYRLLPIRYPDYRTQSMTESLEMDTTQLGN